MAETTVCVDCMQMFKLICQVTIQNCGVLKKKMYSKNEYLIYECLSFYSVL